MSHSGSIYGLESVILDPPLSPIIEEPMQIIITPDYLAEMTYILTELYKSVPVVEPSYYASFILQQDAFTAGIAIQPTIASQIEAKALAFAAIKKLTPEIADQDIEALSYKIVIAHHALVSACLSGSKEKLKDSIAAIAALDIPDDAKKSLFEVTTYYKEHAEKLGTKRVAEFACNSHASDTLNQLFAAGASPDACASAFFNCVSTANKLIPYETLINIIDAFLTHHFDMTKQINNKNLLQHAYDNGRRDIAYIIAHKISALSASISVHHLSLFNNQLTFSNQIKNFPELAAFRNPAEKEYYQTKTFLDALILFSEYTKSRIDSELRSKILPSGKSDALQDMIETLKKLQQDSFSLPYSYLIHPSGMNEDLIAHLKNLESIFSMPRITLYAASLGEWKAFCKDNKEFLASIPQPAVTPTITAAIFS